MSKKTTPATPSKASAPRTITLERTYDTSLQIVWELWTTKKGIESWWGPEGFEVKVRKIDLRPGGEMEYAMTAVAPEQIEFMKTSGLAQTTEARLTYDQIDAKKRLAYRHRVDFIPGVPPYDVATVVELRSKGKGVLMRLTFDAMHVEEWTERAVAGWESELRKLQKAIDGRRA